MDTQAIFDAAQAAWDEARPVPPDGAFVPGENLPIMKGLRAELDRDAGRAFALVYMDPPYFTKRSQGDYEDRWASFEDYLVMLTARVIAARELLAQDGCLWLHLDRRAVHYARVMADLCFGGPDFLVNEVVWAYKSGGASRRRFSNKHDTLLFYAKDRRRYKFFPQKEKSYNRERKPYRFQGVEEWEDGEGWYTLVNMKDVWEIPMVGRTAAERAGYASQKPEALLERIVCACTERGDRCLDPFCGSGTLAAVCKRLGRDCLSIDENPRAIAIAQTRTKGAPTCHTP